MAIDPGPDGDDVRLLLRVVGGTLADMTRWAVFEPNVESTWARVRQTASGYLSHLWRSGILVGTTPVQAFFVRCDQSTMTQGDIDNGRLIFIVGVAPVKPAAGMTATVSRPISVAKRRHVTESYSQQFFAPHPNLVALP
jgi:phage tail sheath protein FI